MLSRSTLTISFIAVLLSLSAALPLASSVPNSSVTSFKSGPPTYAGPAGLFLTGPTETSPFTTVTRASLVAASAGSNVIPAQNPKPIVAKDLAVGDPPSLPQTVPPTVNCKPTGAAFGGCATISKGSGGSTSDPYGLNSVSDGSQFNGVVEPPDQGLCGGAGYVIEILNQGELQVFSSSLSPVSGIVSLDSLMGLTTLGWSSGGDIMCSYDPGSGGHWFITEFVSANSEASGGPFTGCFAGVLDTCYEGIAVSVTSNPMGSYNVYFLNANAVNNDPGRGYLLNDYAKIGTTASALLLFYDEFNQNPSTFPACPAYGCLGFNGAQEFAFSKVAFEQGLPSSSPRFTVAYENMGDAPNLYPIPSNGQFQPAPASCFSGTYAGQICWYQVIPAQTPALTTLLPPGASPSMSFDAGKGYMVASLDFLGAGDNRIAAFDWSGLFNLNSPNCGSCSSISFGGQLLTTPTTYMDEGAACLVSSGISSFCGLAPQKAGPIPLGDNCNLIPGQTTAPCPEGGIATNGDGVTEVSSAQGQLWTAISTVVNQTFAQQGHGHRLTSELHTGAAYFVINTNTFAETNPAHPSSFSIAGQGYISPAHEDIEFPSIAAGASSGAVVAFALSGNGGPTAANAGGYYPSTAFGRLNAESGLRGGTIYIADLGKSPQDGFTEYQGYTTSGGSLGTRPRWGDYGQAIFVPESRGPGLTYFSTEYIQYPNCSDQQFLTDPTCGGTRTQFANWGTSINFVGP